MPLLLVDALEPAEAAALRAHLTGGCPRCAAYLAEADATLAHLPYALDPQTPRPEARARLLNGIEAELTQTAAAAGPSDHRAGNHTPHILKMPLWLRRVLPAAVAACIAFVATAWFMLDSMQKQKSELAAALVGRDNNIRILNADYKALTNRFEQTTQIADNALMSRKFIMLEGQGHSRAFARAWYDAKRNAWHFRAFNLEQLPVKEAYELWFITPYGRKVPAATFRPDERGEAYLVCKLPDDVGPISSASVTDEPSVGTFQPTGDIHLAGKVE